SSLMTRSSFLAGIDGLRPRPALSARPSRPNFSKRLDHVDTVGIDVPTRAATSLILRPSSRNRIILARLRSQRPPAESLAPRSSSARTSLSAFTTLKGLAIDPAPYAAGFI